ncbi:phosphate signaling complex protein PhoU [Paenibacillus puerhi]|uniref:phosphate signaling complex protein PhoU n=1 Tax=Paenibacillus puerhi TaxID=2692622 RepID=UPI00135BDF04|nr:phosphate signaling complex protein PhoU [Paenibacillus puerhi]
MDTRSNFHSALEELQSELLKMGSLAENSIEGAVEALSRRDEALAQRIIENDDQIDELLLEVEENCLRLIALQQPMASDLRIIGTALKIAIDLERIGDHAVDIAKIARRLAGKTQVKPLEIIPHMAVLVKEMLSESLASYTDRDIHRAASLAERDDEVDKQYSAIVDEINGLMNVDVSRNRELSQLMMSALYLERVADHTTNIGESVIYMVTGKRKDLNI